MIDGRFRHLMASNLSGASYAASCGYPNETKMPQGSTSDKAKARSHRYLSRSLSRGSPQSLTLTQLHTLRCEPWAVRVGSMCWMASSVTRHFLYENSGTTSSRPKTSIGQESRHTQHTPQFLRGCSLLMRIQDDGRRTINSSYVFLFSIISPR